MFSRTGRCRAKQSKTGDGAGKSRRRGRAMISLVSSLRESAFELLQRCYRRSSFPPAAAAVSTSDPAKRPNVPTKKKKVHLSLEHLAQFCPHPTSNTPFANSAYSPAYDVNACVGHLLRCEFGLGCFLSGASWLVPWWQGNSRVE